MVSEVNDAVGRVAQEEASTLVRLIEGERRKVLVVAAWIDGDKVCFLRAASKDTAVHDVRGFAHVLEHEHKHLAALLADHADG